MKEIDFYPEIAEKFRIYFENDFDFSYSHNKSLPQMIEDIHSEFESHTEFQDEYVPNLKLDIVIGLKNKQTADISIFLIEVKHSNNLTLKDYSQLSGYLQVSKIISVGILLLVDKSAMTNSLSNDFNEIIQMEQLILNWQTKINIINESHMFHTGICVYSPGNGIDWVNTKNCNGISSFDELISKFK